MFPLHGIQDTRLVGNGFGMGTNGLQWYDVGKWVLGQNHYLLDDILQFSGIAGPDILA